MARNNIQEVEVTYVGQRFEKNARNKIFEIK